MTTLLHDAASLAKMYVEFQKKTPKQRKGFELNDDIQCSRLCVMITVQLHNLIFACKYNRRTLRKVTSSFEEVLYISNSIYSCGRYTKCELYNRGSCGRYTKCELYNWGSCGRYTKCELYNWGSCGRYTKCELYNWGSCGRYTKCELYNWGSCGRYTKCELYNWGSWTKG